MECQLLLATNAAGGDFAAAGKETLHGDGTLIGVLTLKIWTTSSTTSAIPRPTRSTPDCTGTVTEEDENIGVAHVDMYFAPDGAELDYVLTDTGVVDSLVERRVSK
jgi:hypothetical protein